MARKPTALWRWAAGFVAAIIGSVAAAADGVPPLAVVEDFEAGSLSPARWWLGQIDVDRMRPDGERVRHGRRSLAIRIDGGDQGCGGSCQRNEIRIAGDLRLAFGTEAWYGFSFRIDGDVPASGNHRLVVGQWKEETGYSPFLAQRFNGRVFHITVEDDGCRRLVAHARSGDEQFRDLNSADTVGGLAFLNDRHRYACRSDIEIEYGAERNLPDPYRNWVDMAYRVRGGLAGRGLIEVWANGRFVARVTGSIGHREVGGPTQYFKIGLYRDPAEWPALVNVDAFRRGRSREEVSHPR